MEFEGVFLSKSAKGVRETFEYGKEVLTENEMLFKQYNPNPTKLIKKQHRDIVFAYVIETYLNEEDGDCIPDSIGYIPVSK